MKIAVISPTHHAGVTTTSLMLAYTIAMTQAAGVCLTYTGVNEDIKQYVGVPETKDATRSISQVVRLLEANAISPENLSEYSVKLTTNLELMDSASDVITADESSSLLSFVFENIPTDVTICDISSELGDEATQSIFKHCDILVMVVNTSLQSLENARKWKESVYWPKDIPTMLVVNRYDPQIMAISEIAKRVGVKVRDTCKIHYNPLIQQNCNKETLDTVIPYIIAKDPRLIELNMDMKECIQFLFSQMSMKIRWEG